ncbi:uncharacterized protein LOC127849699 [Dreissena polymorpha]|uniref:uncharacterized protein LOC127849699 n=1 Tax=Dreissena polymorpha TaxID=45954 RepID=UPI002264C6E6|nr:uncharacterized protein LOC127849699 [Dreissena polymorpha]
MDLIMCNEQWKSCFWLKCLHRTHALPLKYYDCHSPNSTECLEEMLVASTGYEGHEFKLRLPFSWVIIHMVDEVYRNHVSDTEDDANRIDLCLTTLNSAAEGQLLSDLKDLVYGGDRSSKENDSLKQEILMDYIHDFVHTVYHAETEAELNIVCETVLMKTIKICQDTGHPLDINNQIVCARLAFEELALRLTYFRSINSVWRECSVRICQMKESNPNHFMFKEHEYTFSTLCLLIEDLNPVAQELDDKSTRQKWLGKVHKYRPVVETMLAIPMNDSRVGIHSDSSIKSARSKWSRVVVVKLFIENVCANESEKSITIKYCMPLWQLLRDDVNLSTKDSFEAVEKFLKICNKTAFTEIIGTTVKCGRCEDALQSSPITVPCNSKDILCQKCFTEMKVLEEYRCPVCKEELNKEWEPDIDEKMREEKCVSEYLRKYIDQAELDDDVGVQERIDMYLLIVQCWEAEVSDRYIVAGQSYIRVRELLTQILLGGEISVLENQLETMLLPTMPQDDLEDVHRAVLREQGNENTAVYCAFYSI